MTSFTVSIEQILAAPIYVREWISDEIAAVARETDLFPLVRPAEPAVSDQDEGVQVFILMPEDLVASLDEVVAWWREQRIRARAYAIWEQAGRPEGKTVEHWLQAEAEIGHTSTQGDGRRQSVSGRLRYLARQIDPATVSVRNEAPLSPRAYVPTRTG